MSIRYDIHKARNSFASGSTLHVDTKDSAYIASFMPSVFQVEFLQFTNV